MGARDRIKLEIGCRVMDRETFINKILFMAPFLFAATSGSKRQDQADPPLHHPDVNVNIFRDLPDRYQENMWPDWFDTSLFPDHSDRVEKSQDEWRSILTRSEFRILRNEGTEAPYVNEYHREDGEGVYICRACSAPLYSSTGKFHSSSGWPSFFAPIELDFIGVKPDRSTFLGERTEVHCARCRSHLGHVFEDGPRPTGLRYCMNSLAMRFIDQEDHEKIRAGSLDQLDFVLNR
jgi:peptide-methionine (R)-S-oxide reductase